MSALSAPTSSSEPPTLEQEHERTGLGAFGLGVAGFEKALNAAHAVFKNENSAGSGDGDLRDAQEEAWVDAFYGTMEQTLEAKSEKAQDRADLFESRAAEVTDPARVEILNKRAEISEDRAEFLLGNAESIGSLGEMFGNADDATTSDVRRDSMIDAVAYHEGRAADLTELSELVRENGNPEWADKILVRADQSNDYVETLSQSLRQHYDTPTDSTDNPVEVTPAPEELEPAPEELEPVAVPWGPWLNADSVAAIQTQLNATEEFGTSVVDSVRDISQGEMEAIRDLAVELGADEADLEFFDFVSGELGIKVVFVDDLVSENGAFGAFGGEATIPESEGLGILLDSTFVDIDFDDGMSGINEVSAQGGEVFLHEATHILQAFGIVDFSGEVGDGDAIPELSSGETVGQLDGEDQASFVESFAGDFLEDTAVLR